MNTCRESLKRKVNYNKEQLERKKNRYGKGTGYGPKDSGSTRLGLRAVTV